MKQILTITPRSHRILLLAIASLLAIFVGLILAFKTAHAASSPSGSGERVITVHDDGKTKGFYTKATTLRDALKEAGISVDQRDRTEPRLDEQLVANSYEANIYRARPVIIRDGSTETRVVSAYRTARQIAKEAAIQLHDEDTVSLAASKNVMTDGTAEVMTITRAKAFTFVFYGKTETAYSQASTVAAMLTEKRITLTEKDGVSPSLNTPLSTGMTVKVWRDGTQTVTVDEDVAFDTKQIRDANHERGYKEVQTKGEPGRRTVSYEISTKNGVEVARKEINSTVTKQPIQQVEVIGVKGMYTTPSENEQITWEFLVGKGLTREQTAGIMGNLMQEHGFQTSGDGLAQWTGSRQSRLRSMFPDSYMTIQSQLDYLWYELSEPYAKVLNAIRAQTTVEGATITFQNQYERCGICVEDRRIQFAYNILASH